MMLLNLNLAISVRRSGLHGALDFFFVRGGAEFGHALFVARITRGEPAPISAPRRFFRSAGCLRASLGP
jgi:hypothetical protein